MKDNSENCHRGGQAAMEMTGLMYKPPTSQAELESYKDVYPFSPEQYTEE